MPQLREYNPRINQVIGQVNIKDTQRQKQKATTKMVQYQVGATYKEAKLKLDYILKRYYKFAKL